MELSKKEFEIFEKINLYERYSNISNQYRFEETFENYSNDEVIKIVKELGYSVKYRKKENFFQMIETINGMKFYFHFSLKYGMVESIMGMMDKNKKNIIGGLVSNVCTLIEMRKNIIHLSKKTSKTLCRLFYFHYFCTHGTTYPITLNY